MIINSSTVNMTSLSTQKTHLKTEEKRTITTPAPPESLNEWQDQLSLSQDNLHKSLSTSSIKSVDNPEEDLYYEISEEDKAKIQLLQKLFESLTGKKVQFYIPSHFKGHKNSQRLNKENANKTALTNTGPSMTYERYTHFKEKASMTFSSNGTISTEDGRTIQFNLNVRESRSFESSEHIFVQSGKTQDPLVINYEGGSARLTDNTYDFDLTGTGTINPINFVQNGSGFLAIDKNKDGKINDGSELFGPETGNGFLELAAFDEDQNGWIDEKDSVFEDLLIWSKDDHGKDQLFALLTKDVGAIFLGNVSSQYGIKDTGNNLLGQISSTGIYAKESGGVGTIQHIDLVI